MQSRNNASADRSRPRHNAHADRSPVSVHKVRNLIAAATGRDEAWEGEAALKAQQAAFAQGQKKPAGQTRPSGRTDTTGPNDRAVRTDRPARTERSAHTDRSSRADRPVRTERGASVRQSRTGSPAASASRQARPARQQNTDARAPRGAAPADTADRSAERAARAIRLPSDRPCRGRARPAKQGATYEEGLSRGELRAARQKQYIDPARFVQSARIVEREVYVPKHRFQDFAVHQRILNNLAAKGYTEPTPIQDQTIQPVLEGRDVVGIANTGTGKTAAFSVPLIHDLITHMNHRMLVLAPTRELAQQIVEEILSFSKGCGFRVACLIGGASINVQKKELAVNPRIVVGTPGRIKDHIGQGTLKLGAFNRVVLDEVDRMLDMGFIRDITDILSRVNQDRQSLFFSATLDGEVESLIGRFSRNPVKVSTRVGETAEQVNQNVVYYKTREDKLEKLHDILIKPDTAKTIIFDDTKRSVEKLAKALMERGFKVDRIHGNKSQAARSRAIQRLKDDEINILVATDVAARGIDVSDVTHVINFSQPNSYEDYVHRIGRTGRAGKAGNALTFLAG